MTQKKMATDKIVYTPPNMDELLKRLAAVEKAPSGVAMEAVLDGAEVWKTEMNRRAPGPHIDTNADMKDLGAGKVSVNVGPIEEKWYYRFFEFGTTAHEVSPRNVQAIRFLPGGQSVFSEGHEVGGMAARPFMRPVVDSYWRQAVEAIRQRIEAAILRSAGQ